MICFETVSPLACVLGPCDQRAPVCMAMSDNFCTWPPGWPTSFSTDSLLANSWPGVAFNMEKNNLENNIAARMTPSKQTCQIACPRESPWTSFLLSPSVEGHGPQPVGGSAPKPMLSKGLGGNGERGREKVCVRVYVFEPL